MVSSRLSRLPTSTDAAGCRFVNFRIRKIRQSFAVRSQQVGQVTRDQATRYGVGAIQQVAVKSGHRIVSQSLELSRNLANCACRIVEFPPSSSLDIARTLPSDPTWVALGLVPLSSIESSYRLNSRLSRQDARFYMSKVVAPTIDSVCADQSFIASQHTLFDPLFSAAWFGLPSHLPSEATLITQYEFLLPGFSPAGILAESSAAQRPFPPMHVPQLSKLLLDSGKLAKLDQLLAELKGGGHRVLLYFQMTRMIDLMEEYLAFRQFKYLRLDGSSTISERRDMVMDWQTKSVFLSFSLFDQGSRSLIDFWG